MKPCDINKSPDFIQISYGRNPEISGIYCCDLLSMALGKLKENQILVNSGKYTAGQLIYNYC